MCANFFYKTLHNGIIYKYLYKNKKENNNKYLFCKATTVIKRPGFFLIFLFHLKKKS